MAHIRKTLALGATLLGLWTTSSAQWVVHDPTSMASSVAQVAKQLTAAGANLKQLEEVYKQGKEAMAKLEKVHSFIKDAYKAKECLSANLDILGYYTKDFSVMVRDPNFSVEELAKISRSYQEILKRSTEALKKLGALTKSSIVDSFNSERKLEVSDGDRMTLIESTYQEMEQLRSATLALSKLTVELCYIRARQDGKEAVKRFYALYGRPNDRW